MTPITLQLEHTVQSQARPTPRTMDIAVMFGLSLDGTREHVVLPPIEITLKPGDILFVTGVSGGGKSTLLRRISQVIDSDETNAPLAPQDRPGLICSDTLPDLPRDALVDALAQPEGTSDSPLPPATLKQVCHWLSMAGLNDAAVMLRQPDQLSEGQRHRLRLAQAMAVAQRRPEAWSVLLIDEFGSTLDRTTAHALARSIRRWISQSNVCLVAATTHDDLLEALAPEVLVEVAPGGQCQVHQRSH